MNDFIDEFVSNNFLTIEAPPFHFLKQQFAILNVISEPRVSDVMLPESPDAVNYNLELTTDFDLETFDGTITMTLKEVSGQELDSVTLHAKELTMTESKITANGELPKSIGFDRER